MATIDSPSQAGTSVDVEKTFSALRVVEKPYDYIQYGTGGQVRVLGHYRWGWSTGPLLWSASANLASFRYGDVSSLAVITRIYVNANVGTAVTAQRVDPMVLLRATGFTGIYTAGNFNFNGPYGRMRSTMGTSTQNGTNNIQLAAGAGGMTGPVIGNLENWAIGQAPMGGLTALGTATGNVDLYNQQQAGSHPLVLANNEGFIVQWGGTALATGTVNVGVQIEWAEVAGF